MFKGVKNSLQDLAAETPTDPPTLSCFKFRFTRSCGCFSQILRKG